VAKRPVVKDWTVRVRCVVTKELSCPDCTEEDARTNPFEMAEDEQEIDQQDWEVIDVKENA